MENFYVVIFFVVAVIYNIYKNYKKELEKSAKRSPQRKPMSIPPINAPQAETKEKKKNKLKQEVVTKKISEEDIPTEVLEWRRKKELEINKPILAVVDKNHATENFEFDLRKAVIQSAILERPYQY